MPEDSQLIVKGRGENIVVSFYHDDFEAARDSLQNYMHDHPAFLENARIVLDFRNLLITSSGLFTLRDYLMENKVMIVAINSENENTIRTAKILGIKTNPAQTGLTRGNKAAGRMVNGETGRLVQKTLRSGAIIEEVAPVIVVGDVNPGAVIKSESSIIIWGKCQGEVHAGVGGDASTRVYALDLSPMALSIAGRLFDNEKKKTRGAAIAVLEDNRVKILTWNKNEH